MTRIPWVLDFTPVLFISTWYCSKYSYKIKCVYAFMGIIKCILTGSATMTTLTVALPGVSRATSGVRIVSPASFIPDSIPANCVKRTYQMVQM